MNNKNIEKKKFSTRKGRRSPPSPPYGSATASKDGQLQKYQCLFINVNTKVVILTP